MSRRGSAGLITGDLIIAAHRQLAALLVWVWHNLSIHLAPELAEFAAADKEWLRSYRLPAYALVTLTHYEFNLGNGKHAGVSGP